jgi:hypothetical protein
MLPEKVPQLTIPLSPYLQPGEEKPRESKRIRPKDAIDLQSVVKEMKPNTVTTLNISGKPWSVVSVYSPYSPDVHVMVIETGVNRYLPGPEWVPDEEGNNLMELWATILDFIAKREANGTIHVGYNWSPRAWGKEEEITGGQSVPTKWHAMLWSWPPFPNEGKETPYAKWMDTASLTPEEKRLLGDNNYAEPFGQLIKNRLEQTFPEDSLFCKLFDCSKWEIDGRGFYALFSRSIPELLRTHKFFSQVLKPLAVMLEQITRELTEAMTTLNCNDIDEILVEIEKGRLNDLKKLRSTPSFRSDEYIRKVFEVRGYTESLLEAILEPVWNRCNEEGDPANWWRKGFGYAFVLSTPSEGNFGELRIMPGVFIGPGGVVEAQGVVLRRPLDKPIPDNVIREKSSVLWQLTDILRTHFHEYRDTDNP